MYTASFLLLLNLPGCGSPLKQPSTRTWCPCTVNSKSIISARLRGSGVAALLVVGCLFGHVGCFGGWTVVVAVCFGYELWGCSPRGSHCGHLWCQTPTPCTHMHTHTHTHTNPNAPLGPGEQEERAGAEEVVVEGHAHVEEGILHPEVRPPVPHLRAARPCVLVACGCCGSMPEGRIRNHTTHRVVHSTHQSTNRPSQPTVRTHLPPPPPGPPVAASPPSAPPRSCV